MKKARPWILAIAFLVAVVAWGVMGLKIYDGNYEITTEAYITGACLIVILVCAVSKVFTDKCPHCGKLRVSNGKYCPRCGKEM